MAGNILNIGKSGLFAAQAGLSTTGHNISNANVVGYSRQVVMQGAGPGQNIGSGFIGSGTQVTDIKRYSDEFLNAQVRTATTSKASLDAYYTQIAQIDNVMADPASGLSPSLQGFFKGVQDVASNPASTASRQALLSGADSLAARFQGLNGRLSELREGVNTQITSNVTMINAYADQIAALNEQIGGASAGGGRPNDLMDQRDQLVLDLNKQIKATVVAGSNNSITVSIGNGQPLVVGKKSYDLAAMASPTDPTRVEVGYVAGGKVVPLGDSALKGGELGGLMDFRNTALDRAQNSLGRIAISIAATFNDQHHLGVDAEGKPGADFFTEAKPSVTASRDNSLNSTAAVKAVISDPSKLTQSDYKVAYDGAKYVVTRLSDSQQTVISPYPQTGAQSIDGIEFSINGASGSGDNFLVRPTINGAAGFGVALADRSKIAAGAPINTAMPTTNTGSGRISEGSVDAAYLTPGNALTAPVTLKYSSASGTLSGFPPGQAVTKTMGGVTTVYPAGTAAVPYQDGASYNFGGVNIGMSGTPGDADTFTVSKNLGGAGDNRNMRALGNLQTKNTMEGGKTSFQGAYAEMTSFIGNKTREVEVNAKASDSLLRQAHNAQQSVSGVNLDEEAANLLKYQQAYQAAGKVMAMASTLFDTLLSLGR
ncbi:flagellar hook-associated protein FlgK [Massilia sp. TSP1-1-2]|uniref:flagellar hook-associated protein FlgK n=1 Tax=unclassified Massilia TaxID=2609279 RepID=UPI003CF05CA8